MVGGEGFGLCEEGNGGGAMVHFAGKGLVGGRELGEVSKPGLNGQVEGETQDAFAFLCHEEHLSFGVGVHQGLCPGCHFTILRVDPIVADSNL